MSATLRADYSPFGGRSPRGGAESSGGPARRRSMRCAWSPGHDLARGAHNPGHPQGYAAPRSFCGGGVSDDVVEQETSQDVHPMPRGVFALAAKRILHGVSQELRRGVAKRPTTVSDAPPRGARAMSPDLVAIRARATPRWTHAIAAARRGLMRADIGALRAAPSATTDARPRPACRGASPRRPRALDRRHVPAGAAPGGSRRGT